MKVYVVREIYGSVLGIYKDKEKAEAELDRFYKEIEGFYDLYEGDDWIVEEWEVE